MDAFPLASRERLLQAGAWIDLAADDIKFGERPLAKFAIFPSSCVIDLVSEGSDGSSSEILLIGQEGFCGSSLFPADFGKALRVHVILPGRALRVPESVLKQEFDRDDGVRWCVLRALHLAFEQAAETSACRTRLSLDQMLSRWLVMVTERAGLARIKTTQEKIGQVLGVRREGVSQAMRRLRAAGLIDCRRGRVMILDRDGLRSMFNGVTKDDGMADQPIAV